MGDVDARVHIFTAMALVLRSAAFTPGEIPRYSFYRKLSEPQDQSGHKGVKKNLYLSATQGQTWAHSQGSLLLEPSGPSPLGDNTNS